MENNLIAVHGRAGLIIPYSRWIAGEGDTETKVDISDFELFIEILGARIRKALVIDPNDGLGLRIVLTREDVEAIPEKPTPFIVVDETGEVPLIDWEGKIVRIGYKGDPSA